MVGLECTQSHNCNLDCWNRKMKSIGQTCSNKIKKKLKIALLPGLKLNCVLRHTHTQADRQAQIDWNPVLYSNKFTTFLVLKSHSCQNEFNGY